MVSEPDWESLGEINFLLYRRMSEHLNAALAAITLAQSEENNGKTPEFWQERALNEVLRSLDLHNAWATLVRHKLGESLVPQQLSEFSANELLTWLSVELQLNGTRTMSQDMRLIGNRDTLQEALLLLHSCAYTLGPGVRLLAEPEMRGMWFRISFNVLKNAPETIEGLISTLEKAAPANWRMKNALFELRRARDFLTLNSCEIYYGIANDICTMAFFIPAVLPAVVPLGFAVGTTPYEGDTIQLSEIDTLVTKQGEPKKQPPLKPDASV